MEYINSQEYPPNEAPNVFYIPLTSSDKYGRPEFPVCFFGGATKGSFKNHNIKVITVHDLVKDFKRSCPDWDGKSDIFLRSSKIDHEKNQRLATVCEDCVKQRLAMKITVDEFRKTITINGINHQNAIHEVFRRAKNPKYEMSLLDVFIILFSFIKRHRKDHILVDEVAILHSQFCKFNSNLTHFH